MKLSWNWEVKLDNDLFVSVFNLSMARYRKVNKMFQLVYGKKRFSAIKKVIKEQNGLMGIFDVKPTNDLMLYALMLGIK